LRAVALPPELPTSLWALPPADALESVLATARRELDELGADVPPDLLDGKTAYVGLPWETICAMGRELDADLIVIGAHGYGLLDRLLGTTASKVVNHTDRTVLVVR
jgi:nucleotide-binding universal stress UspA family protein